MQEVKVSIGERQHMWTEQFRRVLQSEVKVQRYYWGGTFHTLFVLIKSLYWYLNDSYWYITFSYNNIKGP